MGIETIVFDDREFTFKGTQKEIQHQKEIAYETDKNFRAEINNTYGTWDNYLSGKYLKSAAIPLIKKES